MDDSSSSSRMKSRWDSQEGWSLVQNPDDRDLILEQEYTPREVYELDKEDQKEVLRSLSRQGRKDVRVIFTKMLHEDESERDRGHSQEDQEVQGELEDSAESREAHPSGKGQFGVPDEADYAVKGGIGMSEKLGFSDTEASSSRQVSFRVQPPGKARYSSATAELQKGRRRRSALVRSFFLGEGATMAAELAADRFLRDMDWQDRRHLQRTEVQRTRREPRRFSEPVPKLAGDIHIFLKRIGQFIASEEVEDEDVFTVLSQAAPADIKEDLWAARGHFRGKPWQEIRGDYRGMLEPGKTRLHYMQDLGSIRPRSGESMAEYHERYNDIRDHAYGPGAYDAEYDLGGGAAAAMAPHESKDA